MSTWRAMRFCGLFLLVGLMGCEGDAPVVDPPSDAVGATDARLPAVVKFCSPLQRMDGMPVVLTLQVGDPPITLSANLSCAPPKGQPCVPVPAGRAVPVSLHAETTRLANLNVDLVAGGEMLFVAGIHPTTAEPTIEIGAVAAPDRCADIGFDDLRARAAQRLAAAGGFSPAGVFQLGSDTLAR